MDIYCECVSDFVKSRVRRPRGGSDDFLLLSVDISTETLCKLISRDENVNFMCVRVHEIGFVVDAICFHRQLSRDEIKTPKIAPENARERKSQCRFH